MYVQQVSSPSEMNNMKDHILTQNMHRNLYEISTSRKQFNLKVIHLSGNVIQSLETLEHL